MSDTQPPPTPADVPDGMRCLRKRVRKGAALVTLHLKHCHMSPKQLGRRTAELALLADLYRRYEMLCKNATRCGNARPTPSRTRIRVMRTYKLGELSFVAHAGHRIHRRMMRSVVDLGRSIIGAVCLSTVSRGEFRSSG